MLWWRRLTVIEVRLLSCVLIVDWLVCVLVNTRSATHKLSSSVFYSFGCRGFCASLVYLKSQTEVSPSVVSPSTATPLIMSGPWRSVRRFGWPPRFLMISGPWWSVRIQHSMNTDVVTTYLQPSQTLAHVITTFLHLMRTETGNARARQKSGGA